MLSYISLKVYTNFGTLPEKIGGLAAYRLMLCGSFVFSWLAFVSPLLQVHQTIKARCINISGKSKSETSGKMFRSCVLSYGIS